MEKGEITQNEQFHHFPPCFFMLSVPLNLLISTFLLSPVASLNLGQSQNGVLGNGLNLSHKQEGRDGPVSLHWLIHEISSYQTLQYLGIGLKH